MTTKRNDPNPEARNERVKQLLAQGLNAQQIGQRLQLSPSYARRLVSDARKLSQPAKGVQ